MTNTLMEYLLYFALLILCAWPLGGYIGRVMSGENVVLKKILGPCESLIYRVLRIHPHEEMGWKSYALQVICFSLVSFIILFLILIFQSYLPGNPQNVEGLSWDLAFNTAVSFVTNTNWQAYSGEAQLSYLSQAFGLTVQNFVSAGVGIAVLFALIRGFVRTQNEGLGNFWVDLTRIILYVLIPLALMLSMALVSQGVIQNFNAASEAQLIEPVITDDGTAVYGEFIPGGPAASQIAIKQLGSNGGGFFGANSAHPFENPTALSNLLEMLSILLIPMALCFTFGRVIGNRKQGITLFIAMLLVLMASLAMMVIFETGNMEGKESVLGVSNSSFWAVATTATSNGSVNTMLDSLTPLGGMISLVLMMLGEVVFGGVGCGLYTLLGFVILTVFIAGLMVGRTPEFLGKKIEPFDMKMAVVICLATPVFALIGSSVACLVPGMADNLANSGPHGFTELLYAYTSASANNGSSFAGLSANTVFLNVSLALCMIGARFIPIAATLALAENLATKKNVAVSTGTLSTTSPLFAGLLILIILIVGALSFFPALALGPLADYFQAIG